MDCVLKGKSRAIKMGYLAKSPSRNREKASYAIFWKVRWCVLVQVFNTDPGGIAEYSTFLLYYYEDEESYKQSAASKGHLDLSQCIRIKSCYKSCGGFNHLFEIECSNGKLIKFSASSCKKKFHWFDALFSNIYKVPIHQIRRSKVISQTRSISDSADSHRFATDGSSLYRKPRSASLKHAKSETSQFFSKDSSQRRRNDSGISSSTMSSISSEDDPPQLPPPRRGTNQETLPSLCEDQRLSQFNSADDLKLISHGSLDMHTNEPYFCGRKRLPRHRKGSLPEMILPSSADEYFYCEKCVRSSSSGSKGIKRRISQKEKLKANMEKPTECDDDYDVTDAHDGTRIYEEIDNEWLEMVRNMISTSDTRQDLNQSTTEARSHIISPLQKDLLNQPCDLQVTSSFSSTAICIDNEKARIFDEKAASMETFDGKDEEIYVPMNLFSKDYIREDPVLDTSNDDVYLTMEDMEAQFNDMKFKESNVNVPSVVYDLKTELNSTVSFENPHETTSSMKDIDSDEHIKKDGNTSEGEDFKDGRGERNIVANMVPEGELVSGCYGKLELSGFSEQYNTRL